MSTESDKNTEAEAQAAAATEAAAVEAAATEAAATEAAAKEAEALAATAAEAAAKEAAAAKDAELPEWARTELARVRDEAAKSRISLRDAMTKFEGAKTPEEFTAAVAELKEKNVALAQELARNIAGTTHKLPPELIAVLKGNTPEELEAHAKVLSKFVTAENEDPENLSGGLTPGGDDGSFDPVAEAHKARAYRY